MKFPKPKRKKKKTISKKIDNYEEMFFYVSSVWGYMCPIAREHGEELRPQSLHHRLPNSKKNRRRFPLFIDSVFNLVAVNIDYHNKYDSWQQFYVFEADKIEKYIAAHREVLEIGYFENQKELKMFIQEILK